MASELAAALATAQAEMPSVDKDATNPHFRTKFVSLDNLIAKTRPVLTTHGLSISQWPSIGEAGQPTLTTRITHSSGEHIENTMPLFLGKQDMQALGAAITYARRYAWAAALGIASDEDDDHEAAQARQETAPANPPTPAATNGKISEAQVKRLFAIAREREVTADQVKEIVQRIAGVASSADIPKGKYDAVIEAVEAGGVPF